MMQFTRIPQQYAPLGGELRYAVEQTAAGNIDIRIAAADGTLLGAKRFAAVTTAAAAPARTFLPGAEAAEAPALLTRMPLNRLIPEGTCDELTLLADSSVTVTVTAQAGDTTTAESYRTEEAGLHLFRLDTPDFPGAETVTVDAGACGTVTYTVIPALEGALTWRGGAARGRSSTTPSPWCGPRPSGSTSSGPRDPKGVSPQSSGRTARRCSYRPTSRGRYWKPSRRWRQRPKCGSPTETPTPRRTLRPTRRWYPATAR